MTDRPWAHDRYILDKDHLVVPASSQTWTRFMRDREVAGTCYNFHCIAEHITVHYCIFTQFTGRDDRVVDNGPPLVFFTNVCERIETEYSFPDGTFIGHEHVDFPEGDLPRYSSWDDAMAGHAAMVKRIEQLETDTVAAFRAAAGMMNI